MNMNSSTAYLLWVKDMSFLTTRSKIKGLNFMDFDRKEIHSAT